MTPQLKQARVLLESWVGPDLEPLSATATFHTPNPHCPGIERWSVGCALYASGLGFEAWELLEKVAVAPNGLDNWLRATNRTTSDVLAIFTKAIQRSKKGAS